MSVSPSVAGPTSGSLSAQAGAAGVESLESASRLVEKHLNEDDSFMELSGQLRIATHRKTDIRTVITTSSVITYAHATV